MRFWFQESRRNSAAPRVYYWRGRRPSRGKSVRADQASKRRISEESESMHPE